MDFKVEKKDKTIDIIEKFGFGMSSEGEWVRP